MAKKPTIDFEINLKFDPTTGGLDLGALEKAFAQVAGKGKLSEKLFEPIVKGGENMVKSVQRQRKQVAEELDAMVQKIERKITGSYHEEEVKALTAQLGNLKRLAESFKGLSELHIVSKEQANLLRQITNPDQYKALNEAQRREHDLTLGTLRQQLALIKQIEKASRDAGMVNVAANVSAQGQKVSQFVNTNTPKTDTERQAEKNREAARKEAEKNAAILKAQEEKAAAEREARNRHGAEIDVRTKLDGITRTAKEQEKVDREEAARKAELAKQQQKIKDNAYKVGKGSELVNLGALNNVSKLDKTDYGSVKAYLSTGESQARLAAARAGNRKEHDEQIALAEDYYAKLKKLEADRTAFEQTKRDERRSGARQEAEENMRLARQLADQRTAYGKQLFDRGISTLGKADLRPVKEYLASEYRTSMAAYGQSQAGLKSATSPADIAKHTADMEKHKQAVQHFSNATVELNKHAKELGGTMTMLNGLFQNFTRFAVGYGALYQLTGAFTALTKEVMLFDKQMRSLQAVSEATDAQMVRISGSIKEVAKSSSFSLTELAEGAKTLAQAGVAAEDLGSALSATEKFARATETSMATAADLITTYRDVYKELSDVTIADQLTKAVNISKLTGEDLKTILSLGASTARDFGIASEQFLGQIATLRNAGIKASTAGTGLRQTMLELFNLDDKAVKALQERYKQIGEDLSQSTIKEMYFNFSKSDNPMLSAITELKRIGFGGEGQQILGRAFDIRAVNAISAMVANIDQLVENEKKLTFGGAAAQAAETQMRSLSNSITRLQNQFMDLGVSMSSGLVSGLKTAVDYASELVEKIDEINQEVKRNGGGNAGSASAGLGGAAAIGSLAFTGKMGFAKRAMVAGGAFMAGTAGGEYAASKGMDAGTINNLANLAFTMQALSALGKAALGIRTAVTVAAAAEGVTATAVVLGKVGTFFGAIRAAFMGTAAAEGIALLLGSNPIGWIVAAVAAVAAIAYFLYKVAENGAPDDLKNAAEKTKGRREQTSEDAAKAAAKYSEIRDKRKNFILGTADKAAEAGTEAATIDKLGEDLKDIDLMVKQYLGGYSSTFSEIKILLDALRKSDTAEQKAAITQRIKELAASPSADLTEKELEALAAEMAGVDASYRGLIDGFTLRVKQLSDRITAGGAEGTDDSRAAEAELKIIDGITGLRDAILHPSNYSPEQLHAMAEKFATAMSATLDDGGKDLAEAKAKEVQAGVDAAMEALLTSRSSSQLFSALQGMVAGLDALGLTAAGKVILLTKEMQRVEQQIRDTKAEPVGPLQKFTDYIGVTGYQKAKDEKVAFLQGNADIFKPMVEEAKKALMDEEKAKKAKDEAKREADAKAAYSAMTKDGGVDRAAKVLETNGQMGDADRLRAAVAAYGNNTASENDKKFISDNYAKLAPSIIKTPEVPSFAETPQEISRGGEIQRKIDELKTKQQYGPELDKLLEEKKTLDLQVAQKKVDEADYELKQIQNGDKGYREAENKVARAKDEYENVRTRNNKEVLEVGKAAADLAEKNAKERLALEQKMAETQMKSGVREAKYAARKGDTATIASLEPGFAAAQGKALDAFKSKLAMDGATPAEIEEQVAARDDLTRALSAQKEVVEALEKSWLLEDRALQKAATRGPTTGDRNKDAILSSQGVGFSREEKVSALQGNILAQDKRIAKEKEHEAWREKSLNDQIAKETDKTKQQGLQLEVQDQQEASQQRLLDLETQRAEMIGKIYQETTNVDKEIKAGFSADKLRRDLSQSGNAIQNYGKSIRSQLVGAWESVGDAIGETLAEGEDFGEQMRQIVHDLAKDFLKLTLRTGMNQLGDKLLGKADGSNSQPGLFNDLIEGTKRLFGYGKEAGPDQVGTKPAEAGGGFFGSILGMLGLGGESKPGEKTGGGIFDSILGFLGLGGDKGAATTAAPDVTGGVKEVANAVTGSGTGTMNVTAAVVNVNGGSGAGGGSPVDQAINAATGEQGAQKEGGIFGWAKSAWGSMFGTPEQQMPEGQAGPPAPGKGGFMESITGLFGGDGPIAKGLGDLFGENGSLGSMLGNLFGNFMGGGGGGGGQSAGAAVGKIALNAAMSYFGGGAGAAATAAAATGGVVRGFSKGGWVEGPSRRGGIIRGSGTGTSDSIPAFAHGRNGSTPIAVSNGEAILTAKATNFLGKGFIDAVNSGSVVKHAAGRFAKESRGTEGSMNSGLSKLHVGGGNSAPPVVENNITNVMDPSVTRDYLESRAGSRVMVNTLKRKGVI